MCVGCTQVPGPCPCLLVAQKACGVLSGGCMIVHVRTPNATGVVLEIRLQAGGQSYPKCASPLTQKREERCF